MACGPARNNECTSEHPLRRETSAAIVKAGSRAAYAVQARAVKAWRTTRAFVTRYFPAAFTRWGL